jgi:hypothetical protein
MSQPHTFSRFAYFDTNVLSELAKRPEMVGALQAFLLREDLTVAVSAQVAELSDVERLHDRLVGVLLALPSAIIKTSDQVLDEEVRAHPSERTDSLLLYPLNGLFIEQGGPEQLKGFLRSAGLRSARDGQRESASVMPARHEELKKNFPPGPDGKYSRSQAAFFAFALTVQWLTGSHRPFLEQFQTDVSQLRVEAIRSVRLHAFVLFYKYYLGGRDPKKPSDFGDLFGLYALPYCVLAVVERDLANVLTQIQKYDPVLTNVEIRDISFVRNLVR